ENRFEVVDEVRRAALGGAAAAGLADEDLHRAVVTADGARLEQQGGGRVGRLRDLEGLELTLAHAVAAAARPDTGRVLDLDLERLQLEGPVLGILAALLVILVQGLTLDGDRAPIEMYESIHWHSQTLQSTGHAN